MRGGDVAVVWEASAAIEVDGVAIDAGPAALGRFDGETGALVAAVGLFERPTGLMVDDAERIVVRGGGALDGGSALTLSPGLTTAPGPSGPWFVRWEAPLRDAAVWRWPIWRLYWLPTLLPSEGTGSSTVEVFVDAALRPGFGAMTAGVGSPTVHDAARLVVANLSTRWYGLEGARPARASLQAIGPGARPESAWVTPDADDVTVLALAADPDSPLVAAVVTARALRGPDHMPVFSAPADDPAPALVFVHLEEARR